MAGVDVPGDVTVEILRKLPVKSLLRFNCVCKTWYSVISDPQFSNNLHRLRPCVLISENLRNFSTIQVESLLTTRTRALTPLSLPWETEPDPKYQIIGSCNGLVCVDYISQSSPERSDLILWNPSTRKFKKLPRPSCYQDSESFTFVWFGYDESIDDYKLIWLNCNRKFYSIVTEIYVFTLKSNTWRSRTLDLMDRLPLYGLFRREEAKSLGVLSNGAIHWLASSTHNIDKSILVLELETEKLQLLKFPEAQQGYFPWIGSFFGGCLCLSCIPSISPVDEDGCYVRNLWVMKEYGVESSWTKVLSIHRRFCRIYPILFSNEGKEMVAFFDGANGDHDSIVKLRVEEGNKLGSEETLLRVTKDGWQNNVVLHMEESLVSFSTD